MSDAERPFDPKGIMLPQLGAIVQPTHELHVAVACEPSSFLMR